jgi:hypothetical protein
MPFALPRAFFPPQFDADPTVVHVALVVVGDFAHMAGDPAEVARLRDVLRDGFALEKDGTVVVPAAGAGAGEIPFAFAEVTESTVLVTTRTALAALTPSPFGGLAAPGDWLLRVRAPVFAERDASGAPLIRRIANALLVLTVEGPVRW